MNRLAQPPLVSTEISEQGHFHIDLLPLCSPTPRSEGSSTPSSPWGTRAGLTSFPTSPIGFHLVPNLGFVIRFRMGDTSGKLHWYSCNSRTALIIVHHNQILRKSPIFNYETKCSNNHTIHIFQIVYGACWAIIDSKKGSFRTIIWRRNQMWGTFLTVSVSLFNCDLKSLLLKCIHPLVCRTNVQTSLLLYSFCLSQCYVVHTQKKEVTVFLSYVSFVVLVVICNLLLVSFSITCVLIIWLISILT